MIFHSRANVFLAASLSCLAGFTDAVGFRTLGGYFVSFMSGNSTRLGVNFSEFELSYASFIPLAIIVLFTLGVMVGAIIRGQAPRRKEAFVLGFVSLCLVAAALLSSWKLTTPSIIFMILGMGASNNVFMKEGEVSVGVTYMTGTLVKLGQRLAGRWTENSGKPWFPYLVLWTGLIIGAILGSLGYSFLGLQCLWGAAVWSAALLCFYLLKPAI